jgi:NlpC/P60 family putative phage cell wall peptidase
MDWLFMSMEQRIVTQARSWLGTPYHHQARLKGVGCDCLGLVVGVADELGLTHRDGRLLSSFDQTNYSHQPDGEYLLQMLASVLEEVPKDSAQSGDVAVFAIDGNPQHVAILTVGDDGLSMIHCYAPSRKVVEHRFDQKWHNKLVKVFRWQPSFSLQR